jgi:hypothetical protein
LLFQTNILLKLSIGLIGKGFENLKLDLEPSSIGVTIFCFKQNEKK